MISWLKRNPRSRLRQKWERMWTRTAELGFWGEVIYACSHMCPWFHVYTYRLAPRHASHGLYVRQGTSDPWAFEQIFIELEYGALCGIPDVRLVIDCGANVGYSSAFFLTQFPACRVIAIEPDLGNFAMLARNLLPYGSRATVLRAGVWSHSAPLVISKERYRDEMEWTFQVRPVSRMKKPNFRVWTLSRCSLLPAVIGSRC